MNSQKRSYLFALLAVLFWSTSASAFKISLRYTDHQHLLFYSSFTATIVLLIFNLASTQKISFLPKSRKELIFSALLGLLNPFFYYLVLFKAFALIPAQQAQPLNFIWPIVTVLLSIIILKQRIKLYSIVALVISFIGVIVISTHGHFSFIAIDNAWGVFLALFSSIIWALFFILNLKDKRAETQKLLLSFGFSTVYIFLTLVIQGNTIIIKEINGIYGGIYIGIFEMGLAFIYWSKALKYSHNTAQVSNLIFLTPFLSLLAISIFVGEVIEISTIIGLIFIIGGIIFQRLFNTK